NLLQSAPFETWYYEGDPATPLDDVPPRTAMTARLRFEYGLGTLNAVTSSVDLATLRDELASAMGGTVIDTNLASTSCANVVGHHFVSVDDDGGLVSALLLTCSDTLESDNNLFFFFEDFF